MNNFFEFLGRIGLILFIIMMADNVEEYNVIFTIIILLGLILWSSIPYSKFMDESFKKEENKK